MAKKGPLTPTGVGANSGAWNSYQLVLGGLRMPVAMHLGFDAVAGVCVAMLGHPWMAVLFFATSAGFDAFQQMLIGRWLTHSAGVDELQGLRKLAVLCAARMAVYLGPTLFLVMTGGLKELIYFGIQLCSLIILAQAAGSLSRLIFWSFAAPVLAAASIAVA